MFTAPIRVFSSPPPLVSSMSSHRRSSLPFALVIAATATLGLSQTAQAQFGSLKDRIKQKAAEKAAEKVGKKVGEAMGDKPAADSAPSRRRASAS
jgi:hypothetical protein